MKTWQAVAAIAFYFSATTAHADILFLDVNNSGKEIDAARKAAAIRGEKLIVIPEKNKAAAAAAKVLNSAVRNYTNTCFSSVEASKSDACNKAHDAMTKASDEYNKVSRQLDGNSLNNELAKLKANGTKLTSLVVSGHDGNGHFGGDNGALSDKDIAKAFANQAPLGDNIRSMMMWGCYTGTIGSLSASWKKTLPNVELIAGYDGIAPLADKPANWQYLSDVLIKEKKLTAIKDANELKKALNGLDGTNLLNASLCVGENYASHRVALDMRDARKLCDGAMEAVLPTYQCYLYAEPDCPNPPADTGNSILRTAYNKLQDARHCEEFNEELGPRNRTNIPSADTLIRLIHFKNVKDNFTQLNPNYLKSVNDLLKKVDAPSDLLWGDLGKMSRAEIIKKLNDSKDWLSKRMKLQDGNYPELQALIQGIRGLQGTLGDLQVPFSWVEPGAKEKSRIVDSREKTLLPAQIAKTRQQYETSRARHDLGKKAEEIISKNSQAYREAKETTEKSSNALMKLLSGENNDTPEIRKKSDELMNAITKSDNTMTEIKTQEMKKIVPQLNAIAEDLAKQPYSSAEGAKAYKEALQNIVQDPESFDPEYSGGYGMYGSGISIGDDAPYGSGMIGNINLGYPQTTQPARDTRGTR